MTDCTSLYPGEFRRYLFAWFYLSSTHFLFFLVCSGAKSNHIYFLAWDWRTNFFRNKKKYITLLYVLYFHIADYKMEYISFSWMTLKYTVYIYISVLFGLQFAHRVAVGLYLVRKVKGTMSFKWYLKRKKIELARKNQIHVETKDADVCVSSGQKTL